MIDTHTHIYLPEFQVDRLQVVNRAKDANVEALVLPNIDLDSIDAMNETCLEFPNYTFPMMGLHPSSVDAHFENVLMQIEEKLNQNNYIGVGEIGIDLYWEKAFAEQQKEAFRVQSNCAAKHNMPVSIHSRAAYDEVISVLKSLKVMPKGVFHCFGGNVSQAKEVIQMGFHLGIGGVVSFKNSDLRNVLEHIDPKYIVLETDAPYLAPHPFRGKRNEPAYLKNIVQVLSEVYSISIEDLDNLTSQTSKELFGID